MKLTIRRADLSDVYAIGLDLSDINRAELKAMFGKNWWDALKNVRTFLEAGPADVMCGDGEPLCVLGHMPHTEYSGVRVTWFLATDAFFNLGVRGVIACRKYIERLRRDMPDTMFYSYSRSSHPHADRWFRLMGYTSSGQDSGHKVYILPLEAVRQSA